MKKATFKNFATIAALALVFAIAFGITFGVCDAHVFAPVEVGYASSAETSATSDYYASVENLSTNGKSFRSSLADLITTTHKKLTSYDGLRDIYKSTDNDPNKSGNIIWFYTGTSINYTGFGSSPGATNREHVWPKDGENAFDASSNAGSDAHHLRPCEAQLNSTRGSKSYGEVAKTAGNIVAQNNSTSYGNLCYTSGGYFYPGDGYRGATARILMYVQTRWGDKYSLQFTTGSGHCKTIGDIKTLMKWHLEEPVTEEEMRRNEAVYKIQGNRNPFIDHPEYAERIYCYDGQSYNKALQEVVAEYAGTEPIAKISFKETSVSLGVGETTTLTPTYAPTNAKREVTWTSSDSTVASVDANGKVTAKANGTATITVASKENSSIKASVTVTVKSVTSISVSGAPTKTTYNDGEAFAPTGLTVTAHFSDGTTKIVPNTSCQWLDGTTRANTLSAGSASVICKYGTHEAIINGITVKKITGGGKTTITLDKTNATNAYNWYSWTAGAISGKGFMFKGDSPKSIQINSKVKNKPNVACYFFNTTPIPSSIISITIKLAQNADGRSFDIYTSNTPYTQGNTFPTNGTKRGAISPDTNGKTLTLNTTDKYFTINYTGSGVCYIESIEILYGEQEAECVHDWSAWTVTKEATYQEEGSKTHSCTKCGHTETQAIPKLVCTDHTYGDWTVTKEATETESGIKTRTCENCGHKEEQVIPKTGCDHEFGGWYITKEPTGTESGEKTHKCLICGHTETAVVPATGEVSEVTAKDFIDAVNAINNATTEEEKADAIAYAESVFGSLTSQDKTSPEVTEAFNTLYEIKNPPTIIVVKEQLPGGAIAGIVIGCVASVAVVAVIAILATRKKRLAK